jgi:hypothetical protein
MPIIFSQFLEELNITSSDEDRISSCFMDLLKYRKIEIPFVFSDFSKVEFIKLKADYADKIFQWIRDTINHKSMIKIGSIISQCGRMKANLQNIVFEKCLS